MLRYFCRVLIWRPTQEPCGSHALPLYYSLLFSVCQQEPVYIVTELMNGGNLLDYLRSDEGHKLSVQDELDIAVQVSN